MISELECRQRWIEAHPDWIPCKLPHFSIKENAFYFLASGQPLLPATLSLTQLIAAIDDNVNIEAVVNDRDNVEALAQLWASGIVTFVPPDTMLRLVPAGLSFSDGTPPARRFYRLRHDQMPPSIWRPPS